MNLARNKFAQVMPAYVMPMLAAAALVGCGQNTTTQTSSKPANSAPAEVAQTTKKPAKIFNCRFPVGFQSIWINNQNIGVISVFINIFFYNSCCNYFYRFEIRPDCTIIYSVCAETSLIQRVIVHANCHLTKTSFSFYFYLSTSNYVQAFTSHHPFGLFNFHYF